MAKYDLTDSLVRFLDRHLVFPLLEFLSQQQLYPEDDIQKGKLDLLQKTNMVDYAMDIYKALYNNDEVPADMRGRRHEVVHNLKALQVFLLAQGSFCVPHWWAGAFAIWAQVLFGAAYRRSL